jgi:phosphoglycerate dehydrogenase-like enzyme
MTLRCAILDDYQNVALSMADWSKVANDIDIQVFNKPLGSADAVVAALQGFGIVCAMRERTAFPRTVIERLPDLKLLITTGSRNASVDLGAAKERGVVVCGTIGLDIEGMTLALLGLGKLGTRMAEIGRAFRMSIIAWSQNLTAERCKEVGAELVGRDDLFRRADFLSIHMQLSERTRGLIGARELGLMKPTAFLINTSRGPIVEEAALLAALHDKRIAGAGLDVFDIEPLPIDHPFRTLDNVVLTPHLGYVTAQNYRTFFAGIVDDIRAFLDGKPVRVLA